MRNFWYNGSLYVFMWEYMGMEGKGDYFGKEGTCDLWPNHIIRTIYDLLPLSQEHPPIIRIRIMRIIQENMRSQTSELPKTIHTSSFFTSAHNLKTWKDEWACGLKGDLWPHLGNYPHFFGIAFTNSEVCGYYADNCSIEKVWFILVPFQFFDQIMRILSALLKLWMGYMVSLSLGIIPGCEHN